MLRFNNLAEAWKFVSTKRGDQVALDFGDTQVSYRELDQESNRIAHWLLKGQVNPGNVVAIFNSKKKSSQAAMIACLKIGAIYVNLDIENPPERLGRIISQCKPKVVLFDEPLPDATRDLLNSDSRSIHDVSELHADGLGCGAVAINPRVTGSSIAYIMYTSGSTGKPKGVSITHDGLLSFISWGVSYFNVGPGDRFAQLSPMYFDNSVFDFYTALFSGACLVPVDKVLLKDPKRLIDYVENLRCTVWFSVPSLLVYLSSMRVMSAESLPSLRYMVFGGEGFPKSELKKLYSLMSDRVKFVNVYGPTEGTCICSAYLINDDDFIDMTSLAPLGALNINFDYVIVNEDMRPVESGQRGELCLHGPNISPGYFNDAQRTSECFVQHPEIKTHTARVYKTGDIVSESRGLLWFWGRKDYQIKHMGYRIELEEIESAFHSLSYIERAAVLYRRVRAQYGEIVAFVTISDDALKSAIDADLKNILPAYMLPSRLIFMSRLPVNANGKVDRVALLESL